MWDEYEKHSFKPWSFIFLHLKIKKETSLHVKSLFILQGNFQMNQLPIVHFVNYYAYLTRNIVC